MIKTRFAPSPTGYLHVGGLRTALYCYLFAKQKKGEFILRIEDTDQKRYVEGAVENLINTLKWVGLEFDEGPTSATSEKGNYGPYFQSKRTEIYRRHVENLIQNGHAYRCFCTEERLNKMRQQQNALKQAPMYDRHCLELPQTEIEKKLAEKIPYVIRQKIPYELIRFKDIIRGNIQFHGKTIDDQILMKSDGFPTYHLANVVDDHLMKITHVIRGEEWLPSTPKHIALYHSFGWQQPEFAHLPLLLNPDRSKLSKRQGHVAVEEYIQEGYLKEAIINFIAFLGWNPGAGEEREIFTTEELAEIFQLEKVHKSGAIFNLEKLAWFNWKWSKKKYQTQLQEIAKKIDPQVKINSEKTDNCTYNFSDINRGNDFIASRGQKLLQICDNFLPPKYHEMAKNSENSQKLYKSLISIEEKILRSPKETAENINFYFDQPDYNKELLTHEKMGVDLNQAEDSLIACRKNLENLADWRENNIKDCLQKTIEQLNVKNGQVLWPLRAALTGLNFSPGAFETADVLGKDETLKRIDLALKKLI